MAITHVPHEGDYELVRVDGRLDHDLTPELEATLEQLLSGERPRLLIDLGDVDYINSGGLRVLAGSWRRARQAGGDLRLCNLTQRVRETIEMVGFDQVFEIFPSRDAADRDWSS